MKSSLKTNPKELKHLYCGCLRVQGRRMIPKICLIIVEKSAHNYVLIMKIYEREKSN